MRAIHKFLIGIIGLIVLGCFGFYFGLFPQTTPEIAEARLLEAAEADLAEAGLDWVTVTMEGQKAILSGTAVSAEEIDRAADIVRHSTWAGGVSAGGITVVETGNVRNFSDVAVPQAEQPMLPVATPFTFVADANGNGGVVLRGFVPSEEIRTQLVARAQELFPGGVTDELVIARGAPEGNWAQAALAHLDGLSKLRSGYVRASGADFTLNGMAADSDLKARAETDLNRTGDAFNSNAEITLVVAPEPVLEPIPEPAPAEMVSEPLAATDDAADLCQATLNDMMRDNTVQFQSGSAVILPESRPLLDAVAETLARCQNFRIEIAGHTDSTGSTSGNAQLSDSRAQAVRNYMADNGVPVSRIEAQGYGESRPVAPNETAAGRAQNRRIEFTILRDQQN
ncbi:OmpA family protein [Parvularcula sp. IMCC14364]|uniref:OmpA family protein n=1 Tax=Parvularcula sp. IMCC14364 TaxID=3067902 RepID=UPI002741EE5C|nr:OmpA family protein [Parvularcula sp. IMCC14364]